MKTVRDPPKCERHTRLNQDGIIRPPAHERRDSEPDPSAKGARYGYRRSISTVFFDA